MQPFDGALYATGYPSYGGGWEAAAAAKIPPPPPLTSKSFPWGLSPVNPLSTPPQAMHFAPHQAAAPNGFTGTGTMAHSVGVPGFVTGSGTPSPSPCPFAGPTPYLYGRDQYCTSIASLRLKAKHHTTSFASYPGAMCPRQPPVSACQYADPATASS